MQFACRPRVSRVLEEAARNPLVYVIAGAGWGKTQAVRCFVQQHDAYIRWIRLTESDNVGSHFWENFTYAVSVADPVLAAKLREFGFPDTAARMKQFYAIAKEHTPDKQIYIVMDDFHWITAPPMLRFVERLVHIGIPKRSVFLISRKEPEINMVSLFAKGRVSTVTEEELRLTQDEIASFLTIRGVPFAPGSLPRIERETHGWPLAVQLLSMALKRMPEQQARALATMKQNVFRLMEREAFADFPEEIQKDMVKLALVSHLPVTPLHEHSDLKANLQRIPFIWFDSMIGDYRIHPLFAEFLQSKLYLLSENEKQEMYRWAAQWCEQNGYHMDAMAFYAKLRDYPHMMGIFLANASRLTQDAAEYYLHILEGLVPLSDVLSFPLQSYEDSVLITLTKVFIPWMLMELGRYDESREKVLAAIGEWEAALACLDGTNREDAYLTTLLFSNYNNLAYLNMHTCVATHKYEFHEYFKKSMYYFKKSSFQPQMQDGPFTSATIRSFACLIGETAGLSEFDEFLQAARQAVEYIPVIMNGLYYGYDEVVACEIAFYKNQPKQARHHAQQAIIKARDKKQYSLGFMAAQYLLRVALLEGDYPTVVGMLQLAKTSLEYVGHWNRQAFTFNDLFNGFFYAQINLAEMIAPWLTADARGEPLEAPSNARDLLVHARCLLCSEKYYETLAVLSRYENVEAEERFLFGELPRCLFSAVARLHIGDEEGALADFERAYRASFSGEFEMPFIELGKHMQELAALAARQADCAIDKAWLELLGPKAAIYVKQSAFIARLYKKEQGICEAVKLTEREQEILNDLYHGLSRAEIAANRYLSINTVKTILQTLYQKLGAENNVDAVRIALETGLL